MVSAIWNAASEGNFEAVKQLINDHPGIDVEIKGELAADPMQQEATFISPTTPVQTILA